MAGILDFGSMIRELLNAIPTVTAGLEQAYQNILQIKDTAKARREMSQLAVISNDLGILFFEKHGIRDLIRTYCDEPKSRRVTWVAIQHKLNDSQTAYNDALKHLNMNAAFKARHPELMDQLQKFLFSKGRILDGIGNRAHAPRGEGEIEQLTKLQPLFDEINAGFTKLRKEISDYLVEFDRKSAATRTLSPVEGLQKSSEAPEPQKTTGRWTRDQKIAIIVGVAALIAAVATPEIRCKIGLEKNCGSEDQTQRFEAAVNRLASRDANSRLTGITGLRAFVSTKDAKFQAPAWNSLVQAIAVEDDVAVRATLQESIYSLPASQPMLDDGLKTIIGLNTSLIQSLVNPAVDEHHLPTEPLAHSQRLVAMANAVNALVKRGAKSKNFDGIYCVGCDFRSLSGSDHVSFRTADLDAADFSGVMLSSADFSHTSLVQTNFDHAILHDANFDNANDKPFLWYQSFADDPADTGPDFHCADLTGSSFDEFLVQGYKITRGKNGWYPAIFKDSPGSRWRGTNIAGTKFNGLAVYFISTEGKISTRGLPDDYQASFKDVLGKERWMGIKTVYARDHSHLHGDPVLDAWDDVTWRGFGWVLNATDATLPQKMSLVISSASSDPRLRQQLQQECSQH